MDMDKLMGMLQTMMDNNQARADKTLKETLAEIKADRKADKEEMLAAIRANEEVTARMHDELKSTIEEKVKGATQFMRAELDETIRLRVQTEVAEMVEKARVELQAVELSHDGRAKRIREDLTMVDSEVKATRKEAIEQQRLLSEKTEADMREFRARLEEVRTASQPGGTLALGASTVQPPTFEGKGTWSVFRRQFEIVAEHNRWSDREKSTHLITALKGRAADVLYGILTDTTYEETLRALEDGFGDQSFSAAYRCQLTSRTQKAGESLQDFATAIEQLAHRAYPTLPEDHVRREAGRVFTYGVRDPDIKIQLLLGGEKSVNETLGQALELQAIWVAASPAQNNTATYGGNRSPPARRREIRRLGCWNCGEAGHLRSDCPYGRMRENNRRRDREFWPPENKRESPRGPRWQPCNSGGMGRDNYRLSGNGQKPADQGGRRHMH
jgi:hypothetical protein